MTELPDPDPRDEASGPTSLQRLPRAEVAWAGAAVALEGAELDPELVDLHQALVLWAEVDELELVGGRLVDQSALPGALVDILIEAMFQPAFGSPRRPMKVLLSEPALAIFVRERLAGTDIEVGVSTATTLVEDMAADFVHHVAQHGIDRSFFAGEGATPDLIAALFRAAAAYWWAAPWRLVDAADPVELRLEGRRDPCYAVVLGNESMQGFALLLSSRAYALVRDRLRSAGAQGASSADALILTFEPLDTLPPTMRGECEEHGWEVVGPDAVPVVHREFEGRRAAEPDAGELELLATCLDAVAGFTTLNAAALARREAVSASVEALGSDGVRVWVQAAVPAEP